MYSLDRDKTTVGNSKSQTPNDVILNGVGIRPNHCNIVKEKGKK